MNNIARLRLLNEERNDPLGFDRDEIAEKIAKKMKMQEP